MKKISSILLVLYLIACVLTGAIADGLNDSGVKVIGHLLEALEIGLLLSCWVVFNLKPRQWAIMFISYMFIRVGLFDYAYNLSSGNDLAHVGTSNLWDRVLLMIPPHGILFIKSIFLIVGVAIPINEL